MALLSEADKLAAGKVWRDKMSVDRNALGTITRSQIIAFEGTVDAALNSMELGLFAGLPAAVAPWASANKPLLRQLIVELMKKRQETL